MELYRQVAIEVKRLIEQGALRAGERVPSVRKLSRQQKVSVSTVLQAYLLLENGGLIEARPQSGYYVRTRARALPPEPVMSSPSGTATSVEKGELIVDLFKAETTPGTVRLGCAYTGPSLFPVAGLNRAMVRVMKQLGDDANSYELPPGNLNLRRQIARRSLELGRSLDPNGIVITVGGMEALNLCLRAVARAGDTVAIESPTYFGILQVLESMGMKALEIPTHPREGISLDALAVAVRKNKIRAVISMTNGHNPLGSYMPDEKKKQLVALLARVDVPLIEDDVYGDLYFGERRPRTAWSYDRKGLVLLCSSFSKSLSPGYRVGWTVPGPRFQARVENLKFMSTIATATLPQAAVAEFLSDGGYERHLRRIRRTLATQVELLTDGIQKHFPAGTRVTRPQGGFVVWVEMPRALDAFELRKRALKEKISIAPGPIFSAKEKYRNFIRLNCGLPWTSEVERAVITIGQLARDMAKK
ncbi:MAG: PLP-dependent aminotransferase family protein [Deltaproteobacteria bacterium]|nr:PLP-dependent aminotransferase family protein [Deltaproteobacteria bacterium]